MGDIIQFPIDADTYLDVLHITKVSPEDTIKPTFILDAWYRHMDPRDFSVANEVVDLSQGSEFIHDYLESRSKVVCASFRGLYVHINEPSTVYTSLPHRIERLAETERKVALEYDAYSREIFQKNFARRGR